MLCTSSRKWKKWCENLNVKNRLYTEIEYIESTGTQYIDTGLIDTEGWKADIEYEFTKWGASANSAWTSIIGTNMLYQNTYYRSYLSINPSQVWVLDVYSDYANNNAYKPGFNRKYEINASTFSGNGYLIVNGTTIKRTNVTFNSHEECAGNLAIFSSYSNLSGRRVSTGKLYKCKLYNKQDEVIRDFIPVLDGKGVPCLYDKVTKEFYYNQGEGEFDYGEKQ